MEPIKNRYEFVIFFDGKTAIQNSSPDAGTATCRVSTRETGYGLVTDVCLNAKSTFPCRMAQEGESIYRVYVKDSVPLDHSDAEACSAINIGVAWMTQGCKEEGRSAT